MKNKLDLKKYENQWIAVKEDRAEVVASAVSIKKLNKVLDKIGDKESVITFIPKINTYLSPYGLI